MSKTGVLNKKYIWKHHQKEHLANVQLPFKCASWIDDDEIEPGDEYCPEFFAKKAKWEEHVAANRCYRTVTTYL